MLSSEVSIIDVVLMIAVIILLLLFLAQKRGLRTNESELLIEGEEESLGEPKAQMKKSQQLSKTRTSEGFQRCIHNFGYLRNLPENTPVPNECFGCPKAMRCLFPNEQNQLVH